MKTIKELTEQEILKLTEEQLEKMFKIEKAKKGIKILQKPIEPDYLKIPEKDCVIYSCSSLGDLAFKDIQELQSTINHLKSCKSVGQKNYSSEGYSFKNKIKPRYSSEDWDKINSERVFREEVMQESKDSIRINSQTKSNYEKELKEFNLNLSESKEISQEIMNRYREVCDKYYKLDGYVSIMKREYLPLADDNLQTALKFLSKAYNLSENEKQYVLDNVGEDKN